MFSEDAKVLVDADSLFFRLCCVTQDKKEIRKGLKKAITDIRRKCMSDEVYLAVKGKDNFRKDLYPEYKANRKPPEDHIREALNYAHQLMVDDHGAVRADGMEADDLVSIWAREATAMGTDYVVAGIDKDLLQIPGLHYNYQKDTFMDVSPDEGDLNLMHQCLIGDTADNIPGIRGVGPVKARKILSGISMPRRWSRVRAAWRQAGQGDPSLSYYLLKMLETWEDLDHVRSIIEGKTPIRKRDVLQRGSPQKEV